MDDRHELSRNAAALLEAVHRGDATAATAVVRGNPDLLHENLLRPDSNWGPPMSHAANLGHLEVVEAMHAAGARDLDKAFDRACLQGHVDVARRLLELGATLMPGVIMGPAETQNAAGMKLLLDLGAEIADEHGNRNAPVAMLLETYSRSSGKGECLELLADAGVELPDTAPMAVHRGRLDLLTAHLERDDGLLERRWFHEDIYPPELGCHEDRSLALHGTPIAGGGLLHLCIDFNQAEMASWLLERGIDVDQQAAVDAGGFGGHTALYGTVVSQPYVAHACRDGSLAAMLIDAGADRDVRASLRKRLRFVEDEAEHEYSDVTPYEWGRRFHNERWVNPEALALVEPVDGR